jgi:hypothetical protein
VFAVKSNAWMAGTIPAMMNTNMRCSKSLKLPRSWASRHASAFLRCRHGAQLRGTSSGA